MAGRRDKGMKTTVIVLSGGLYCDVDNIYTLSYKDVATSQNNL